MAVTVNVTGTKSPTHHLSLTDSSTTLGFILPDGARSIQEIPYRPSTLKTAAGGTRYSDFELPYAFIQQNDWSGGRGQEDYSQDPSKFYDSGNLWSLSENMLVPAPQWRIGTGLYSTNSDLPGEASSAAANMAWQALSGTTKYLARSISAVPASFLLCWIWVRRVGTPTGALTFEFCSDNAGNPGTVTNTASITTSTITDNLSVLYPFGDFSTDTITAATTYWLKIYDAGTPDADNYWQVGVGGSGGTLKQSSGGSSWSTASLTFWYHNWPTIVISRKHFFEYDGALYLATEPFNGGAGQIFINGDRGAADSNTGTPLKLNDATKSWTTNEWAGNVVMITGGPARGEFSLIVSNTSTQLTVYWPFETTHTTSTNYVILGSKKWTEQTSTGITKPITSVAISNACYYTAQGNAQAMYKHREYNNAGTWTVEHDEDGANKADFLVAGRDPTAGMVMWRGLNSDSNSLVSISRAPLIAYAAATALAFGTAIPIGSSSETINGMAFYNGQLMVGKSDSLWAVNNDIPEPLGVALNTFRSPFNNVAMAADNLYFYFNWAWSLERLYGSTMDDIGPWRDAGMPSGRQGAMSAILPTPWGMLCALDGFGYNYSSVLLYRNGWHEIYRGASAGSSYSPRINALAWQSVIAGPNRLWIGDSYDLFYMDFPAHSLNPTKDSAMRFQHEAYVVSSWMDADFADLSKYVKELTLRADNLGASQTVVVGYQTNASTDASSWTETTAATSPSTDVSINTGAIKRVRYRLRLLTAAAATPAIVKATVMKLIARGPMKYRWIVKVRLKDNATTLSGVRDHDPDTVLSQLKTWASATTPLTLRAIDALSAMDNQAVFIEPPSTAREYLNKVMGFFGGTATFEIRQA